MHRVHRDQRGQSLVIVLSLITILFLLGSALAVHASAALRATRASESQGDEFYAADAATELGIWWQRNGKAGNPPAQTINGVTTSTTINTSGGGGGSCPADPTPNWLSGLESGVFYKYVNNSGPNTLVPSDGSIPIGGWYDKSGDVAIVTSPVRTGSYALKVHSTATTGAFAATRFALPYPTYAVMRFSVWFDSLPSADVDVGRLAVTGGSNYTVLHAFYKASSQKWAIGWGWAGPTLIQEGTVTATAGAWASFDLRVSANNQNPRTADWYVDGVAQTSLSATDTANATNVSTWYIGYPPNPIFDVSDYFDDIVLSRNSADFPLGDIKITPLKPNAIHADPLNYLPNFQDNDSTAVDAASYTRVDEIPMTPTTDWEKQVATSAGGYVGFDFEDTTQTCIRGASVVAALKAQSGSPNAAIGTNMLGPATGANNTTWSGTLSTTLAYTQGVLTTNCCPSVPGVGPWTQAGVNNAWILFGYCTNITSTRRPEIHSVILELAYRPMTGGTATVTIIGTGGASTVTTDYPDAGAGVPVLSTWTVTK